MPDLWSMKMSRNALTKFLVKLILNDGQTVKQAYSLKVLQKTERTCKEDQVGFVEECLCTLVFPEFSSLCLFPFPKSQKVLEKNLF